MSARILRNGLFSALTAVALGFGATQAFAAPDAASAAKFACDNAADARCNTWCQGRGYDAGICNPIYVGGCQCFHY
jgi:hypothetical protein